MTGAKGPVRALGLCSGGLDSMLSALVLRGQGIDVHWVAFETPFFSAKKAKIAAEKTHIPLTVRNITAVYLEMMQSPSTRYGKHLNPCIDCHTLMFRLAGQMMTQEGFDFLFSGEVLGQRPMSQNKSALRYVEKHSGYDGYILRPLSAQKLPETLVEQKGLVDRSRLLGISGRGRKTQLALAKTFKVVDFPAPAGGCLLTDKLYSRRLQDLFDHQKIVAEKDLELLKYGRHFRLSPQAKLIVGRNRQDNEQIERWVHPLTDSVVKVEGFPGPLAVMPAAVGEADTTLAAGICAGYSQAPPEEQVTVSIQKGESNRRLTVLGIPAQACRTFMV